MCRHMIPYNFCDDGVVVVGEDISEAATHKRKLEDTGNSVAAFEDLEEEFIGK